MQVMAKADGFDGASFRRKGEVFECNMDPVPQWVTRLDGKPVAKNPATPMPAAPGFGGDGGAGGDGEQGAGAAKEGEGQGKAKGGK